MWFPNGKTALPVDNYVESVRISPVFCDIPSCMKRTIPFACGKPCGICGILYQFVLNLMNINMHKRIISFLR